MKLVLNTDGGARGNPGPGAIGVVIKNEKGVTIKEIGKSIGRVTNNEAEYFAIIEGLNNALELGATDLVCYLDSELVVNQLNGKYRVKDLKMKLLWPKVKNLEKNYKSVSYAHVTRDKNKRADFLVNTVLDSRDI